MHPLVLHFKMFIWSLWFWVLFWFGGFFLSGFCYLREVSIVIFKDTTAGAEHSEGVERDERRKEIKIQKRYRVYIE